METHLRLQVEYERSQQQKPFIPVLPIRPTRGYKLIPNNELAAIKQTQRCPFPSLRQLMLVYTLPISESTDIPICDILHEKLAHLPATDQTDFKVNQMLQHIDIEKKRLAMLSQCTNNYIKMRENIIGRDRLIQEKREEDYLKRMQSLLDPIQRKKEEKLQNQMKKGGSIREIRVQAQADASDQILQVFRNEQKESDQKADVFLQKQSQAHLFNLYASEYQKALIIIIRQKSLAQVEIPASRQDLFLFFQKQITTYLQKLQVIIQKMILEFFEWRNQIKHGNVKENINVKGQSFFQKGQTTLRQINSEVYEKIPSLVKIIKNDREDCNRTAATIHQKHKNFTKAYVDIKQVAKFYDKSSIFNEVLQDQKRLLTEHLKKNYGMMVPYKKSEAYQAFTSQYSSSSSSSSPKPYLNNLIVRQTQPLQTAIGYINNDYQQLYNQACEGRQVKSKIKGWMDKFQNQINNGEEYGVLMMESCRKLMMIAKK